MKFNQIEDPLIANNNASDETNSEIRVNMHCHSSFSDGIFSPEQLAKILADSEIKYAALTDHNTVDGLPSFRRALMKYEIGFVSGVEITTQHKLHVIHLLAYGFDLDSLELKTLLNEKTSNTGLKILRTSSEIINLIHELGGIVILAHPFQTEPELKKVRILIKELKELELDGIEAIYGPNSSEEKARLLEIAAEFNLLITAGTDYHKPNENDPNISISEKKWKPFRDALIKSSNNIQSTVSHPLSVHKKKQNHWFPFLGNILLPAFLTVVLFIVSLSVFLLPYFEDGLMELKRENIRELTQVAWSVLNEAYKEVENGHLDLEQAQTLAKNRISAMRYGPENRDYFWLQDTSPRILMHPYRSDLNNQDVSDFKDAQGTRIFVEFATLVKEKGEGYISYVWQWMDETDRIEPKESYIRFFEPWGWIIGTGIYVSDVKAEMDIFRSNIVTISAGIIFIVLILMFYLIQQGMLIEKSRSLAERLLLESTERYQALSEAATEGALFIYDGRCRYANTVMHELLGCNPVSIELLDLYDVFPKIEANKEWLKRLSAISESAASDIINGVIRRYDGSLLSCNMTLKSGLNDPKSGCMILVRRSVDISGHTGIHIALNRLLHIPSSIASDLAGSIKTATNVNEVVVLCKKTPGLVVSLLENGTSSVAVAYMISVISDLVTQKIIELNINEIGKPPATFSFLALGSQGRQSQTLFSDQDNAIIYQLAGGEDENEVKKYFLKLATRVCDDLELAGYQKCKGNMIASNPKWCQTLPVWKAYFAEWIRSAEPQQIVEFSIIFDFRPVSGNYELALELRNYIYAKIQGDAFFLTRIAQNALLFKTPMRLFGNIVTSGGNGIDIKTPAMAIVGFARLYAMKHSIRETNTLLQLDAINGLGIILVSKHRNIVTAYEILVRMRLWNQVLSIQNNQKLDNTIDQNQLGNMEELILRESFKEIDELQALIQRDFFG